MSRLLCRVFGHRKVILDHQPINVLGLDLIVWAMTCLRCHEDVIEVRKDKP